MVCLQITLITRAITPEVIPFLPLYLKSIKSFNEYQRSYKKKREKQRTNTTLKIQIHFSYGYNLVRSVLTSLNKKSLKSNNEKNE